MDRQEILTFLSSRSTELREKFGVTKIGLAGSFARGEAGELSDVDIIVELKSENKFRSFFNLLHYLEDSLHMPVDLATESSLKPVVRDRVIKDIIYV
jgi:predicted nucleotidyltransferase